MTYVLRFFILRPWLQLKGKGRSFSGLNIWLRSKLKIAPTVQHWWFGRQQVRHLQGSEFVQPKTFHDSKNYLIVSTVHGLRTPSEEIAFPAQPKIKSQSQIFQYRQSIFCLPHRSKISDFFDLYLYWLQVVRGFYCQVFIRNQFLTSNLFNFSRLRQYFIHTFKSIVSLL